MNDANKAKELRQGVNVFIALAVLTALEFAVAVLTQVWVTLLSLAVIKVMIVMQYYMHLPRVVEGEAHA
jgi:heme/copper-type cytochrome/quinol oxidase subunit 4